MASPINAALDNLYRRKVIEVSRAMSKRSTFIAVLKTAATQCNNCVWDATHSTSSGRYNGNGPKPFTGGDCPVCKGKGTIEVTQQRKLQVANVQWAKPDVDGKPVTVHGSIPSGHARIKILKEDRPIIEQAEYFLVDGVRCKLVGEARNRGLQSYVMTEFLVKKEK